MSVSTSNRGSRRPGRRAGRRARGDLRPGRGDQPSGQSLSVTEGAVEGEVPDVPDNGRSLRLLGELLRPVRWSFAWMSVMVVLAQLALVASPAIIAYGIDTALPALLRGELRPTVLAGVSYVLVGVAAGGLTYGYYRQSVALGQRMLLTLRRRVFRHTQALSLEFHERYTSGRVISRQTSDMDALRDLLEMGVPIIVGSPLYMLLTAVSIIRLDWPTAVLMMLMLVPGVFFTIWFQTRSAVTYRDQRTHSARLIVHFVEILGGIRAIKAFRRESASLDRYQELANDYADANKRSMWLFGIYQPGLRLLGNATVAVVMLVGGLRVVQGAVPVGVLLALVLYAKRFFQPIDEVASFYNSFQSAVAALEKIAGLLAEVPSVREPIHPVHITRPAGRVEFRNVDFRYTPLGPQVLKPFSLTIPAGQTVALVGQTGAGKSTLAKLVARFYDVSDGRLLLDGVDIRDLASEDLHREVVMVTQESYLFSGTVAENIEIGRPGAGRDEIEAAARAVGADSFIRALPEGYDTNVNKRGGRLSAGQQQLVSFARAFLADPAILILDEATSSLDIPSERLVQAGLTSLLGQRTSLIIAHRLSTVMIADRVLVVHDGRIVEDGSPSDLIAAGGRFAGLYRAWQESL